MFTSRSCSWCHSMNPVGERFCGTCGHDAQAARPDCSCPHCSHARRLAAAGTPILLADAIGVALARVRAGTDQESPEGPDDHKKGEAMTKRKTKTADESPTLVTREITRTPVSEKLAKIVREMDEALMEEFGPVWFAYCVLANDGIVGASNARDGFLPPIVATPPAPETK